MNALKKVSRGKKSLKSVYKKTGGNISLLFSSERLIYAGKHRALWGHQSMSLLH